MTQPGFPKLVSLAAHDLRTPLATVHGFTRTLRKAQLGEPHDRYVELIEAAAAQIAELVAELSLVARVEAGTYAPRPVEADTLALAHEAREAVDPDAVSVSGSGAAVRVDRAAIARGIAALAHQALRYTDAVAIAVDGRELAISPVSAASIPVLLGTEWRDLGAAAATLAIRAGGGALAVDGDRLVLTLPA